MIDADSLANHIRGNADMIVAIMVSLGFDEDLIKVKENGKQISSPRLDGDNKNGIIIYPESLHYWSPTRGNSGNVFTFVMDTAGCSFPEALKYIAKCIGYEKEIRVILPFHGFYKAALNSYKGYEDIECNVYDESLLPSPNNFSQGFFRDGINFQTQKKFGVRYDEEKDEVLIPIRDSNGRLVGCKSRNNDPHCSSDRRYYARLKYPKNKILYGYSTNAANIIKNDTIIIYEAEKSVQQADSFNLTCTAAIGGHSISSVQAHLIKSFGVKRVIVGFDKDVCAEEAEFEAKKLIVDNNILHNEVYFINDKKNLLGSKDSPSDHGGKVMLELLKTSLVRVH